MDSSSVGDPISQKHFCQKKKCYTPFCFVTRVVKFPGNFPFMPPPLDAVPTTTEMFRSQIGLPSNYRAFVFLSRPTITEVSRYQKQTPSTSRRLSFLPRPLPRGIVTVQVCRRISAVCLFPTWQFPPSCLVIEHHHSKKIAFIHSRPFSNLLNPIGTSLKR